MGTGFSASRQFRYRRAMCSFPSSLVMQSFSPSTRVVAHRPFAAAVERFQRQRLAPHCSLSPKMEGQSLAHGPIALADIDQFGRKGAQGVYCAAASSRHCPSSAEPARPPRSRSNQRQSPGIHQNRRFPHHGSRPALAVTPGWLLRFVFGGRCPFGARALVLSHRAPAKPGLGPGGLRSLSRAPRRPLPASQDARLRG